MDEEIDLLSAIGASDVASTQVLTLYIPSTDKKGQKLENQEYWVNEASKLCCLIGGGVTVHPPSRGGWQASSGEIVWDEPIILYTFVIPERFMENLKLLRKFLHRMGRETKQGEVAFSFDNSFYRITKYDKGEKE